MSMPATHRSPRFPLISAGPFRTATPPIPINKNPSKVIEGLRRSRSDSIIATKRGVAPIITAVYAEWTLVSAIATKPFPPNHKSKPDATTTANSFPFGIILLFRKRATIAKRMRLPANTRMADIVRGGNPAPCRTATRMAR